MVIQEFLFLDSTSGAVSNEFFVSPEAESMTIQIESESAVSVKVYGKVDRDGAWNQLSAVGLSDLSINSEIKASGIYTVGIEGVSSIRIVNSGTAGSVKAYARIYG